MNSFFIKFQKSCKTTFFFWLCRCWPYRNLGKNMINKFYFSIWWFWNISVLQRQWKMTYLCMSMYVKNQPPSLFWHFKIVKIKTFLSKYYYKRRQHIWIFILVYKFSILQVYNASVEKILLIILNKIIIVISQFMGALGQLFYESLIFSRFIITKLMTISSSYFLFLNL